MGGLTKLNSTAHLVSCEPYWEFTSLGLLSHMICKWMRLWERYYLLSLNKNIIKTTKIQMPEI